MPRLIPSNARPAACVRRGCRPDRCLWRRRCWSQTTAVHQSSQQLFCLSLLLLLPPSLLEPFLTQWFCWFVCVLLVINPNKRRHCCRTHPCCPLSPSLSAAQAQTCGELQVGGHISAQARGIGGGVSGSPRPRGALPLPRLSPSRVKTICAITGE